MKKYIIKFSNRIYGYILGLLGFSLGCQACGQEAPMYGTPPTPEYGCPVVSYVITGKVTDKNNNPIKDIQVEVTSLSHQAGNTQTDRRGEFLFKQTLPYIDIKYTITFRDLDGKENGGEFIKQTQSISFTSEDYTSEEGNKVVEVKKFANAIMWEEPE